MRHPGAGIALLALLAGIQPLAAAEPLDVILARLRADGYEVREVSRTWLGRIRVEADGRGQSRELVFNRVTGEILRDYSRPAAAGAVHNPDHQGGSGPAGGPGPGPGHGPGGPGGHPGGPGAPGAGRPGGPAPALPSGLE
ncbi:MAG: hypothetical protein U1E34_02330 [Amaricoccus sp.]